MNKKVRKAVTIALAIIMLLSMVATVAIYFI